MTIPEIKYKTKTASEKEICSHLMECNNDFIPHLDQNVSIPEYSKKIYDKSVTFEAWAGNILIGLVAAYFNDTVKYSGYITSVSIIEEYKRKGVGSVLLHTCIDYAIKSNFKEILLEVSRENKNAIRFYNKFGFLDFETKDESVMMKLILNYSGSVFKF
jgi:GNAT superfamily N-acetyltransferase